ncbi:MAG: hypothetical protein Q9187_002626 [Circinaria calcarea]
MADLADRDPKHLNEPMGTDIHTSDMVDMVDMVNSDSKPTYKSFKKKYRKMRHAFEEKMKISNSLFGQEQKSIKLARRLQEQNDQLLDLLLEVNESTRISPYLRYDLRSPTPSESAVPALEPDLAPFNPDVHTARAASENAKNEPLTEEVTPWTYGHLIIEQNETVNKPRKLSQLKAVPHTVLESVPPRSLPHDINTSMPAGYLSPNHEEEYLSTLDAALELSELGTQAPPSSHPIRSNEKHEKEREVAVGNPVSVHNWLRKYQPQVFLQDNDLLPEKPVSRPATSSRAPKRSSIVPKQEPEIIDDEGYLISGNLEGSAKNKRKREDEPYRPKGGSSRSTRKKRCLYPKMEKTPIIQTLQASTVVQDGPLLRLVKIGPGTGYCMMPVADNLRVRRYRAGNRQLQSIAEIRIPPMTAAYRNTLPQFTHHPVENQDPNPLTQDEKEFLAEYEQRLAELRQLPRAIFDNAVPFYHEYPPPAQYPMMHGGQYHPASHHQTETGNHALEHRSPNSSDQSDGGVNVESECDEGEDNGVKLNEEELEELEPGRENKEEGREVGEGM